MSDFSSNLLDIKTFPTILHQHERVRPAKDTIIIIIIKSVVVILVNILALASPTVDQRGVTIIS